MQEELYSGFVTVFVEMIDATRVEARRTTNDTVNLQTRRRNVRVCISAESVFNITPLEKGLRKTRNGDTQTYLVSFLEKKLREIRTVLTGNTSN
jgi:hypothetical protein